MIVIPGRARERAPVRMQAHATRAHESVRYAHARATPNKHPVTKARIWVRVVINNHSQRRLLRAVLLSCAISAVIALISISSPFLGVICDSIMTYVNRRDSAGCGAI